QVALTRSYRPGCCTYLSVSYSRNLSGVRSGRRPAWTLCCCCCPLSASGTSGGSRRPGRRLRRCLPAAPPPPAPTPAARPAALAAVRQPVQPGAAHLPGGATANGAASTGDLVSFTFGSRRFVILNSYAVIKEALTSPEWAEVFSGRINSPFILSMTHGKGIVSAEGELWREHRRFALKVLRDSASPAAALRRPSTPSSPSCKQTLDAEPDRGWETDELVPRAIANVISVLLFNYRAGTQDEGFTDFMLASQENLQGNNIGRFIPTAFPGLNIEVTHRFCRDQIDRHRRNLAEVSEPPTSWMPSAGAAAAELKALAGPHPHGAVHRRHRHDLQHHPLGPAVRRLHPECQDRIAAEVEAATGNSRLPVYRDKKACTSPWPSSMRCSAYSTLAPFSVGHRCTRDIRFKGYDISSNDLIMVNLYGVHHDPELWDQPEQFRPERSSNSSGEYETSEFLVPFSIGKRACLGESLARQELFLFLSGIFQAYRVELPQGLLQRPQRHRSGLGRAGARTWQAPDHLHSAGSEVIRWSWSARR
uniref:Cytochrome P450 n=1 Tax=Macrostomum lignano TaxID=282301 RepID=A0A1I8IVT1_9PLAT